ncbi:MAG: SDR family NAD(P)-dependent oxidoreductase [Acidimicrobiales bacterium]
MIGPARLHHTIEGAFDRVAEASVVGSFSRLGYQLRSRREDWRPLDAYPMRGRTVVVTGATSGIGRAAAERLAALGAELSLIGRNRPGLEATALDLASRQPSPAPVHVTLADLGHFDEVRRAAAELAERHPRVDALIHNAGALLATRHLNPDGIETTVASQVAGPYLLTAGLLPRLARSGPGRVITMSSGGMYTADLTVDELQMGPDAYVGAQQYARAKRAQVTLNELWANQVNPNEVVFHCLHPGWVDTPGVASSLPRFDRLMRPLLRTPAQGCDTMVWLAAADEPSVTTGGFWLDRAVRPIHRLARTRRSDRADRRARLWDWCTDVTGGAGPS